MVKQRKHFLVIISSFKNVVNDLLLFAGLSGIAPLCIDAGENQSTG